MGLPLGVIYVICAAERTSGMMVVAREAKQNALQNDTGDAGQLHSFKIGGPRDENTWHHSEERSIQTTSRGLTVGLLGDSGLERTS